MFAIPGLYRQILLDAYPIWHIDHALFSYEFQNSTMGDPLSSRITKFEQHGIINMKRSCRIKLFVIIVDRLIKNLKCINHITYAIT